MNKYLIQRTLIITSIPTVNFSQPLINKIPLMSTSLNTDQLDTTGVNFNQHRRTTPWMSTSINTDQLDTTGVNFNQH